MKNIQGTSSKGFTLVELLIAVVITSIISGAIVVTYQAQNISYTAQNDVAVMQQNIRSGLRSLSRDLRLAGFNPEGAPNVGFVTGVNFSNGGSLTEGISTDATNIAFTMDLDGDGNIDEAAEDVNEDDITNLTEMEQVAYRLNGTNLQRYSTTTGFVEWNTVAEGIERIEFLYILDDDTATTTPAAADLVRIRSVQISILALAMYDDSRFEVIAFGNNDDTRNPYFFTFASGATYAHTDCIPAPDVAIPGNMLKRRRRLLITTIACRNMGV
jgi:type IV pilus assembly protein PilW